MHHTRTCAGEATALSQGSVRHYAGMLAEGTAAEVEHQRHPENSLCLGQSHTCLPGYPGLVFVGNMFGCLSVSIQRRNEQPGIYPKQHVPYCATVRQLQHGDGLKCLLLLLIHWITVFQKHFYILFTCI